MNRRNPGSLYPKDLSPCGSMQTNSTESQASLRTYGASAAGEDRPRPTSDGLVTEPHRDTLGSQRQFLVSTG